MKFILIGGKSKDSNVNKIEKYAISLTNKEKPKVLVIPYASKNIKSSMDKFYKLVSGLNMDIDYMDFDNISLFEEKLKDSDIIYVLGGVSDDLVSYFIDKKLDVILKKYLDSEKIYVGSSAGAMLVTQISMGDKYMFSDNFHNYNYKMVDCLNILNISICPHYQNEDLIIYNDEILKYNIDSFGIEEDTALVIDNNKFYCIKDNKKSSIYYFDSKNNYKMIPLYEGEIYEKVGGFRS